MAAGIFRHMYGGAHSASDASLYSGSITLARSDGVGSLQRVPPGTLLDVLDHAVVPGKALAVLVLVVAAWVAETVFVLVIHAHTSEWSLRSLMRVHEVRRLAASVTAISRLVGLEGRVPSVIRRHYHATWTVMIRPVTSLIVSTCTSIEHWILVLDKVRRLPAHHFKLPLAWLIVTASELVSSMVTVHISSGFARMGGLTVKASETRTYQAGIHHLVVSVSLTGVTLRMSARGRHCVVKAMARPWVARTHVLGPIATGWERGTN